MIDTLREAANELKRCDHLINVSLKYTRTVDVLISVLKRFISCTNFIIDALYIYAEEKDPTVIVPESPIGKANGLKKLFEDKPIIHMLNNYILFRRLIRSEYTKAREFRRYVTMTVYDGDTIIEIDIDKVEEYHEEIKKQYGYVEKLIKELEKELNKEEEDS